MTLQEQYKQEEKKLQRFDKLEDAVEYARKHLDCSTADKACVIMRTPDKKEMVVAPLPLCSYLHREGYKEIIGKFKLYDVLQGEAELSEMVYDTIEES